MAMSNAEKFREMGNHPKSSAIRMREYRARQKALKAAATQHLDVINENMRNANCESLCQQNTVLGNNYNSEPLRIIVPVDVYKQDFSPLYHNSNCLSDLHKEALDDQKLKAPISAAHLMRAYRARLLKDLKTVRSQRHDLINENLLVANYDSLPQSNTVVDENTKNSEPLRIMAPEDVHQPDSSTFCVKFDSQEQTRDDQNMNEEKRTGQTCKKRNVPISAADRMRAYRARLKFLNEDNKKAKNPPKSGAVRAREYRARQRALKTSSSQHNDFINGSMVVENCESLRQPDTVDESIYNTLRTIVPVDVHQADSSPFYASSNPLSNIIEKAQDNQERNAVKKSGQARRKQNETKISALRSPENRARPEVLKEDNEKTKNSPKSTTVRVREYRARLKALKTASSQHNDFINGSMVVEDCESLHQPDTVGKNINNTLRTIVPVDVHHQADSSPFNASSDRLSNIIEKAQDNQEMNTVKKSGQARRKQNETQISAQRSPKNRARPEVLNEYYKKTRNPPKSRLVRVREYRARLKALKTASSQHNDFINENMNVANCESLPQPNAVDENIYNPLRTFDPLHQADSSPLYANLNNFCNLNDKAQDNQEKNAVRKPGPAYKKQNATKTSAQYSPSYIFRQKVLSKLRKDNKAINKKAINSPKSAAVRVREYRARQKALKTATSRHSDLINKNVYAVKWESLLQPGTVRIIVPLDGNQPDSSPLQAHTNHLSDVHEQAQDDQEMNAMSTKKKRGSGWTEEVMAQALTAIKNDMPLIRASKEFNIPRRTLRNHVATGKSSKKLGCTSALTPEQETELCFRIYRLADTGMPLTSQLLRRSVVTFCIELNAPRRFKNDTAGRKWLHLFLKRHPEISERMTETTNLTRSAKLNRQVVCDYFDKLKKLLLDFELMDKPERIFNIGEKVCNLTLPYQHEVFANEKSESATIVGCGNAIGNSIPPMILLKSERFKSECVDNLPIGTAVEVTVKGRMTSDIFSKWVHHFAKFKPPGKVLLIFDGTKSHLDVNICNAADENDILLLCLPSNCTQELQPLDKAVFKSFESYWGEESTKYWARNPESSVIRFGEIFFKVWVKSMTPENIITGFEETGIFPFDFTIIPEVAFAPSSSSEDPIPDIYNSDVKIEIKQETLEDD